jgi:hypothetical protein
VVAADSTLLLSATGVPSGLRPRWVVENATLLGASEANPVQVRVGASGVLRATAELTLPSGAKERAQQEATIHQAPTFDEQPLTQDIEDDATLTLRVRVSGNGSAMFLQWFQDEQALIGETSDTLTRPAPLAPGAYRVQATSVLGDAPTMASSQVATVRVAPPIPVIGSFFLGEPGVVTVGRVKTFWVTRLDGGSIPPEATASWTSNTALLSPVGTAADVFVRTEGLADLSVSLERSGVRRETTLPLEGDSTSRMRDTIRRYQASVMISLRTTAAAASARRVQTCTRYPAAFRTASGASGGLINAAEALSSSFP